VRQLVLLSLSYTYLQLVFLVRQIPIRQEPQEPLFRQIVNPTLVQMLLALLQMPLQQQLALLEKLKLAFAPQIPLFMQFLLRLLCPHYPYWHLKMSFSKETY
jgi:hypothetical protein